MNKLTNLNTVKKILGDKNISALKMLGQNFLINEGILEIIIKSAELEADDLVVEVGPGLGVLTAELIKHVKKVICLEIDKKIVEILRGNFKEHQNLEIKHLDALKFPPPSTAYKVVANIPYNITSPLISHFLQNPNKPQSMTLMVQKEVAQKITTLNPKMTILSLQTALFAKAKLVKIVKPGSFYPSPKVDSAIIHLQVRDQDNPEFIQNTDAQKILFLAKTAFSQKRKKMANTLAKTLKIPAAEIKNELQKNNISPDARPEILSVNQWRTLTKSFFISNTASAAALPKSFSS